MCTVIRRRDLLLAIHSVGTSPVRPYKARNRTADPLTFGLLLTNIIELLIRLLFNI